MSGYWRRVNNYGFTHGNEYLKSLECWVEVDNYGFEHETSIQRIAPLPLWSKEMEDEYYGTDYRFLKNVTDYN